MSAGTQDLQSSAPYKPWVYFPKGFEESIQIMYSSHGRSQSTTLFPKASNSCNIFLPMDNTKNYNRQCESISVKSASSTESTNGKAPESVEKHNGIADFVNSKLPTSIDSFLCFTCGKVIRNRHFSKHLLFGSATCHLCHVSFKDCKTFKVCKIANFCGKRRYCGYLTYSENPLMYLLESMKKLEQTYIFNENNIASIIINYLHTIKFLEYRLPWKAAIKFCKNELSKIMQFDNSSSNIDTIYKALHENTKQRNTNDPKEDYFSNVFSKISDLMSYDSSGCILSQEYSLQQLEDATEFVSVNENALHKQSEAEKANIKREKIASKRICNPVNNANEEEEDETLEFLPVPSNGFYYVSINPAEKCPNCDKIICPSRCKVNINSFLVTYICPNCHLTVYFTSPKVQVLTIKKTQTAVSKKKHHHYKKRSS